MPTKHTPATPLPFSVDEQRYQIRIVGSKRNKTIAMTGRIDDETRQQSAYIAHAANAYPRLVEALRDMLAAEELVRADKAVEKAWGAAYDLLRELGEE